MGYEEYLAEYKDYLDISTNSSYATKQKYYGCLRLFLLDHHDDWANIDVINKWLSNKAKRSNTYLYKYAVRHFLISQGRKDLTMDLISVKKPTRKKVFNFIEKSVLQKMINHLPDKYKKLAFLQIKTGARIGTILTLRAENIDFHLHDQLIYIKAGYNKTRTKGSKELNLRLNKKYEDVLRSWMPKGYGFLFLPKECETMEEADFERYLENQRRYFDNELAKVGKIFNIEHFSSHYLRHLFSDYFLKAGGDPIYLKEVLGHSRLDTTMNYVSISSKLADKALLDMES